MNEYTDITEYIPVDGDRRLKNPYLDRVLEIIGMLKESGADVKSELAMYRPELIAEYSFSIPVYPALKIIADAGPIVEIGAGSGYWAWCLTQMGAEVHAIDSRPPGENDPLLWNEGNRWFEDSWVTIIEGDERALAGYSSCTLFMAWPEIHSPMAVNSLRMYRNAGGRRLIYIGDPKSSGDDDFHLELSSLQKEIEFKLPGWPCIGDKTVSYTW
jgi:hypothetical protein